MDLAGYAQATLDALPSMLGQRKVTVAGLSALELRFTGQNRIQRRPVSGLVLLVVQAGQRYTLSDLGETPRSPAITAAIAAALKRLHLAP